MRLLHALGHALAISGTMTWEILWALILGEYAGRCNAHRRTGHGSRSRPPDARIHLSKWPMRAKYAGTGSAV